MDLHRLRELAKAGKDGSIRPEELQELLGALPSVFRRAYEAASFAANLYEELESYRDLEPGERADYIAVKALRDAFAPWSTSTPSKHAYLIRAKWRGEAGK